MNNNDERDYAEESANRAVQQEEDHCMPGDCIGCRCCCAQVCADVPPNAGSAS